MNEPGEAGTELWRDLLPVLSHAGLPIQPVVRVRGPRSWWAGALDVEGLALGSVEAVAVALHAYAASAKIQVEAGFTSEGVAASFASWTHVRVDGQPIVAFAPLSGFRRSADGWVRLHANYPHHIRALLAALRVLTAEEVDAALLQRTSAEIEDAVTDSGGIAVRVRTPEEWAYGETAGALRREPWIRFSVYEMSEPAAASRGGSIAMRPAEFPLAGIRILDFSRVVAGPSATRLLGALGADVLRIDPPQMPELLDMHLDTGFDKRSAFADVSNDDDLNTIRALLLSADAVLLGYRGCALARFGLDAESLRELRPDLPVVTLDAWGDSGPWASRRGFDSIVQAATGISSLYGSGTGDGWKPGALPVQALDHAVGMGSAAAIIALLAARQRGVTGSAHLSLARTAHQLLHSVSPSLSDSNPFDGDDVEVPLRNAPSPYGELTFVPPPLFINGRQLEYRHPPRLYGSDSLEWLAR